MPIAEFKDDYKTCNSDFVISKWIMEKIPHIFASDYATFIETKISLGKKLGVDSCAIVFVGSSSTGFSLNPSKNFKKYDDKSDIDIAIISNYHFNIAWHCIRNIDKNSQMPIVKSAIDDHRQRLVFWGTIATDKLLGILPFGKSWAAAIDELKKNPIFEDRKINFRLYQDHDSLRAYHRYNLEHNIINILEVEPQSFTL